MISRPSSTPVETRVLILAPGDPELPRLRDLLADIGIDCLVLERVEDLCLEIERGAGVIVLTGDAIEPVSLECLVQALSGQPDWSEIPLVVIGAVDQPPDRGWRLLSDLTPIGTVSLLEHPVQPVTLVSAVLAGLKARERQYELRNQLAAAERNRIALKKSVEALRDADRRRDNLLAMLAHELRNPLGPIRNAVHVLDLLGPGETETARVRRMIDRQVSHLARLLDDLLDVSRITSGRINLRRERLDLVPLLRATAEDHRVQIESAGLSLAVNTPSSPLWVSGDPIRLSQVLANLVDNACKFTQPGGRVSLSAWQVEESVRVAVRDTGIGMEAGMLNNIFDSFTQADHSLDRSSGGLGLGLALVKGLVELHGGGVEAASEGPGRGSQFTLTLPADHPPDVNRQPEREERGERFVFRILIVEDNVDAAESLGVLLQLVGHKVAVAHNGSEGLIKALEFKPDVVLCDIGLPDGMDGYAVARALRNEAVTRGSYLIALTGYGQEEDLARARISGFDLHLTKPVDPVALRKLLSGPLPLPGHNGSDPPGGLAGNKIPLQ